MRLRATSIHRQFWASLGRIIRQDREVGWGGIEEGKGGEKEEEGEDSPFIATSHCASRSIETGRSYGADCGTS